MYYAQAPMLDGYNMMASAMYRYQPPPPPGWNRNENFGLAGYYEHYPPSAQPPARDVKEIILIEDSPPLLPKAKAVVEAIYSANVAANAGPTTLFPAITIIAGAIGSDNCETISCHQLSQW